MSRRLVIAGILIFLVAIIGIGWALHHKGGGIIDLSAKNKGANMQITSSAFNDNKLIPAVYTCKGQGINPPLAIAGVPSPAKSLVLIMHDPDAPSGDFLHWLVWNVAPQTTAIAENSVPFGAIQGKNTSGTNKYIAPCPPSGTHHYVFDLYALDTAINLPDSFSRENVETAMSSHVLARATLIGLFSNN
jgi:Raf kinase inhibitor-like YbhB/YbcL family protein